MNGGGDGDFGCLWCGGWVYEGERQGGDQRKRGRNGSGGGGKLAEEEIGLAAVRRARPEGTVVLGSDRWRRELA